MEATVTSKGQVTLPKQIRDSLVIHSGDRLEFSILNSNKLIITKKTTPGSSKGCGKSFVTTTQSIKPENIKSLIKKHIVSKYSKTHGSV